MLKINDTFENVAAGQKLQRNFSDLLLLCVEVAMEDERDLYFPERWDCSNSEDVFKTICRKLVSSEEEELNWLESYVLYHAIEAMRSYLWEEERRDTMPLEDRRKLMKALGERIVLDYENMRLWTVICFPDTDFLMLDDMSNEEQKVCCGA